MLPLRRLLLTAIAACALAPPASALAGAQAWPVLATDKVFPTSVAPTGPGAVRIYAGRGEYEGAMVAVRSDEGIDVPATVSDLTGPGTIPASEIQRFRVGYVPVSQPSTGVDALASGRYPDPLIPLEGGLRVPAGETTALYLLVHVPAGAPAGRYAGQVDLGALGPMPVALDVFPVPVSRDAYQVVARLEPMSLAAAAGVAESDARLKAAVYDRVLPLLREHGVSPGPAPFTTPRIDEATWSGSYADTPWNATATNLARALGMGFPRLELPILPGMRDEDPAFRHEARWRAYARSLTGAFGGAVEHAFALPVDEPAEGDYPALRRAAAAFHAANPAVDVMATEPPSPDALPGIGDAVDIWAPPLWSFYQYRDAMEQVRAQGKGVWWYTYGSDTQRYTPNFLIDKPTTEARVNGWLAAREGVQGMFYWSLNSWRPDKAYQDPWAQPWRRSHVTQADQCGGGGRVVGGNGEASLLYPGPDLARPVYGSLRLEALRDGIEDYSVLQALKARDSAYFGRVANGVARPYSGVHTGFKPCSATNRPPYLPVVVDDPADLDAGRVAVLTRLSGGRLVTLSGRVVRGGKPVAGAYVRFGIFSTTTAPDGRWVLADVAPVPGRIVVSLDPEGLVDRVETDVTEDQVHQGKAVRVVTPPLRKRPQRAVFAGRAELARFVPRRRPARAAVRGTALDMTIARHYTKVGTELPAELHRPPEVEAWYPRGARGRADRDWRGWRYLDMDIRVVRDSAPDEPWRMVVTPGNWRSARYLVVGQARQHLRLDLAGLPLRDVRYLRFGLESAVGVPKRHGHRIEVKLRVTNITLTK